MPRANRSYERRNELIPIVAGAFGELGYRATTTAELARRCEVQENILYRLWPDKRAMFIAAIEYVYDHSSQIWEKLLVGDDSGGKASTAERLIEYESRHHGEFGLYRIIFAGLTEIGDEAIREALCRVYSRYHAFIERRLQEHRGAAAGRAAADLTAWALIGMGTAASIGRELGLILPEQRQRLWEQIGRMLLDGRVS
jgi:AcrR family transcriptional regulator